jgi:hypothetical protein
MLKLIKVIALIPIFLLAYQSGSVLCTLHEGRHFFSVPNEFSCFPNPKIKECSSSEVVHHIETLLEKGDPAVILFTETGKKQIVELFIRRGQNPVFTSYILLDGRKHRLANYQDAEQIGGLVKLDKGEDFVELNPPKEVVAAALAGTFGFKIEDLGLILANAHSGTELLPRPQLRADGPLLTTKQEEMSPMEKALTEFTNSVFAHNNLTGDLFALCISASVAKIVEATGGQQALLTHQADWHFYEELRVALEGSGDQLPEGWVRD